MAPMSKQLPCRSSTSLRGTISLACRTSRLTALLWGVPIFNFELLVSQRWQRIHPNPSSLSAAQRRSLPPLLLLDLTTLCFLRSYLAELYLMKGNASAARQTALRLCDVCGATTAVARQASSSPDAACIV
jgi:hypothetical protein